MTINDAKQPSTVYLRPSPKNRDIQYIESIEKSAMIVDEKNSIAMYVSKAGPNQGATLQNYYDTIIASASDEYSPIGTGGPKTTFRAPYPLDLTNGYVRISLTTAPTGAAFIVRLTVNGVDLFTPGFEVQIDAGMKTSVGSVVTPQLAITDIPNDAEFLVYVNQVGSGNTGTGLKVAVTGVKAD